MTHEELVRFFSVLSHDLKSPIFAVDGFSDLLLSDYLAKLDEEGQDFLRRIRSSAQYMKRVLDEMSHLVKLLARPSARKPTPLREVGEGILKYNFQIEEGGVQSTSDRPPVVISIWRRPRTVGALIANPFSSRPSKGERRSAIALQQRLQVVRSAFATTHGHRPPLHPPVFELGGMSKLDNRAAARSTVSTREAVIESQGGELTVDRRWGGTTFAHHSGVRRQILRVIPMG